MYLADRVSLQLNIVILVMPRIIKKPKLSKIYFLFFIISLYVKGKRIKKTNVHLQNAREIGGTYSTPPRATTKFDAMKIG